MLKVLYAPHCAGKSTYIMDEFHNHSSVYIIQRYTDSPVKKNGLKKEDLIYVDREKFDNFINSKLSIPVVWNTHEHRCAIDFKDVLQHELCIMTTGSVEPLQKIKTLCLEYCVDSLFYRWLPPQEMIEQRLKSLIQKLSENQEQNKETIRRYKLKLSKIPYFYHDDSFEFDFTDTSMNRPEFFKNNFVLTR